MRNSGAWLDAARATSGSTGLGCGEINGRIIQNAFGRARSKLKIDPEGGYPGESLIRFLFSPPFLASCLPY